MPVWLHISLVIVITVYFLYKFIKEHFIYELLFVIWVPTTLLTYIIKEAAFIEGLGVVQIILFLLVIFFMFRKKGAKFERKSNVIMENETKSLDDTVEQNK